MFQRHSTERFAIRECKSLHFCAIWLCACALRRQRSADTTNYVSTPLQWTHCPPRIQRTTFSRHSTDRIVLRGYNEPLPSADKTNHASTPFHLAHCPPRIKRTTFPRHSTESIVLRGYNEPRFHAIPPNALPSADTGHYVSTPFHRTHFPARIQGITFPRHSPERISLRGYKALRFSTIWLNVCAVIKQSPSSVILWTLAMADCTNFETTGKIPE